MSGRPARAGGVVTAAVLALLALPRADARPYRVGGAPSTVIVTVKRTYVRVRPGRRTKHYGVVARGARLAIDKFLDAPGCQLGWYRLRRGGWVCAEEVEGTNQRPGGRVQPIVPAGKLLPYRYYAVGHEDSGEYLEPADAASDYLYRPLTPRTTVTVTGSLRYDGERFYRTTRGTYVPASEVRPVRASRFQGLRVTKTTPLPIAFVHRRRAAVFRAPGRRAGKYAFRYQRFAVRAKRRQWGTPYLQVGPERWIRARDVRLAERVARPRGVGPKERWIDVDVAQQILVAYEGDEPYYVTLVSTGKGDKTPLGAYRVWAKLAATDMKDGPVGARRYHMWNVPWTAFFSGSYAIHGTYWHDRFGFRRSAGCVNLAPRDARLLFAFLQPALPAGWWAILPHGKQKGTVIRVRRGKRLGRRLR